VFLLTADLGWIVVEPFAAAYPTRFLNVGVAEANLAGVATGLALAGYTPFIYSIATFTSMRCYEQVRNGPVLHRLPVRVIGIGGGFSYGHAGPTHHALEDLAICRTQPGLTVFAPADPMQTATAVRLTQNLPGPVYLRVGKGGDPPVPGLEGRLRLDCPELVREGTVVLLLTTGSIVHEALQASCLLDERGISTAVAVMAHLPFAPSAAFADTLAPFPVILTVEEGFTAGGLGALAAEAITRHGLRGRLRVCGVGRSFAAASGSQAWYRRSHGIDAASLAETAAALVEEAEA
jgi:transketolase